MATTTPKDNSPIPNVLFRLPPVDANIQAGLREFLPNYHDGLNDLRMSAQVVKHVYDSRPDIAREVLQKIASGEVRPTEVLPNPKFPDNGALLIFDKLRPNSRHSKNGTMAIEISANGRGVDAKTLMTVQKGYLAPARKMAEGIKVSRSEGRQGSVNTERLPHQLPETLASQAHPAADFPMLEPDSTSLPLTQDLSNLAEIANDMPNHPIEIDGEVMTLSDAVKRLDAEARDTEAFSKSFEAATNCKLRRG